MKVQASIVLRPVRDDIVSSLMRMEEKKLAEETNDILRNYFPNVELRNQGGGSRYSLFFKSNGDMLTNSMISDGLAQFIRVVLHCTSDGFLVLLDEPDTHLFSGVQCELLRLFESKFKRKQFVLATHSIDLLTSARLDNIVSLIPNTNLFGKSISYTSIQLNHGSDSCELLETFGSDVLNTNLVRLTINPNLLIVENKSDHRVLLEIATKLNHKSLPLLKKCVTLPYSTRPNSEKVINFVQSVKDLSDIVTSMKKLSNLGNKLRVFTLVDGDFFTNNEQQEYQNRLKIAGIGSHIWRMTEIENYVFLREPVYRFVTDTKQIDRNIFEDCWSKTITQLQEKYEDRCKSEYEKKNSNFKNSVELESFIVELKSRFGSRLCIDAKSLLLSIGLSLKEITANPFQSRKIDVSEFVRNYLLSDEIDNELINCLDYLFDVFSNENVLSRSSTFSSSTSSSSSSSS